MKKNLDFVLFYQYFDHKETLLKDEICDLQTKAIYRQEGKLSAEDLIMLITKKISLDTLRRVERDLAQFFRDDYAK